MDWQCSPEMVRDIRASIRPLQMTGHLRDLLQQHFPKDCSSLPITGGLGYEKSNPIKFLPSNSLPYDFVALEYHISQKILYEELIITRHEENRFSDIQKMLVNQSLIQESDQILDWLVFDISCWHDWHWERLKAEWEANELGTTIGFDVEEHQRKRAESMIKFRKEFWFDITDVFDRAKK